MQNPSTTYRAAAARASAGRCTKAWLKAHQDLSGTPAGDLLTIAFPGWDGLEHHAYGALIQDLSMQWDLTGGLPAPDSPIHSSLGILAQEWVAAADAGTLDPVTWALMDRHAPGWFMVGARRNLVRQRTQHWAGFRAVHGRDPKESSADIHERSLAGWIRRSRTKNRRGTLTLFEANQLGSLVPGWKVSR